MANIKPKLYQLLYEWLVSENCDNCQHLETFRDGDKRHPCNRCEFYERFKLANNIHHDLNDKVNQILCVISDK